MNGGPTVDFKVRFAERRSGRKSQVKASPPARVPRIAKLMALAIHLDGLLRDGKVKNQAELARLGHVSRTKAHADSESIVACSGHSGGDPVPGTDDQRT